MDDLKIEISKLYGKQLKQSDECIVLYADLFTNDFMAEYTGFQSLRQMIDSFLNHQGNMDWSQFVATHSEFNGWEQMFNTAHALWSPTRK